MKILITGFGSIGKRHLENITNGKNNQIIIWTKRKNLEFKKKNIKVFNSLKECLSEKPDIAFVTNETVHHIPTALELARNNLDLFVEKPISNSMKNVNKLCKIVEQKRIITLIGCNLRFHTCIQKIKELIESKTIGDIISVKVECGTYLPDWHPNEDYSNGYAARDDLGGGVVLTCIHELDYLYWFLARFKKFFLLQENLVI